VPITDARRHRVQAIAFAQWQLSYRLSSAAVCRPVQRPATCRYTPLTQRADTSQIIIIDEYICSGAPEKSRIALAQTFWRRIDDDDKTQQLIIR